MHLNHPLIQRSILFNEDVLIGTGAVDEEALGTTTGGCEGWGLIDAARLLASVWFVIGPSLGRTLFYLTIPLIPAASTMFFTRDGNGICILSVEDSRKSLIMHHMTKA